MPVISMSIKHGRNLEEARAGLANVVQQVQANLGMLLQRTDWQPSREQVKLVGTGFEIDLRVDATDLHVSGEIPLLSRLLGDRVLTGIKTIVQNTFQKRLGP